jgi:hypothetical protein
MTAPHEESMNRLRRASLLCILAGFTFVNCTRERGVEAAGERVQEDSSDIYQPRSASAPRAGRQADRPDIRGELIEVDVSRQTIMVRTQNGMEQTVKFDARTNVTGRGIRHTTKPGTPAAGTTRIRSLKNREGSEVSIRWRPEGEIKVANAVILLD